MPTNLIASKQLCCVYSICMSHPQAGSILPGTHCH